MYLAPNSVYSHFPIPTNLQRIQNLFDKSHVSCPLDEQLGRGLHITKHVGLYSTYNRTTTLTWVRRGLILTHTSKLNSHHEETLHFAMTST